MDTIAELEKLKVELQEKGAVFYRGKVRTAEYINDLFHEMFDKQRIEINLKGVRQARRRIVRCLKYGGKLLITSKSTGKVDTSECNEYNINEWRLKMNYFRTSNRLIRRQIAILKALRRRIVLSRRLR